jgi:hypothetical protein
VSLTDRQKAELLIRGIEVTGLDVDQELERIGAMPGGFDREMTIAEYQMAALSARMDELPGAGSRA